MTILFDTRGPDKTLPLPNLRGRSSVGRAFEWHSKGQGFDSPRLHTLAMAQSPAEPPLVFIHDWFSDPTTEWSAQVARFGRDYDCNYFRLAGHGDPAEELHQDQPILDHNLSALGNLIQSFARPVRLVAHGIGAGLALRVAALMPERLSCLVVIAPVFRLERLRWLARLCVVSARARPLPF